MGMYATRDVYVLYNQLLEEAGWKPLPAVSYEKRTLRYEDVYPMLYLKYRLLGKRDKKTSNIWLLMKCRIIPFCSIPYWQSFSHVK